MSLVKDVLLRKKAREAKNEGVANLLALVLSIGLTPLAPIYRVYFKMLMLEYGLEVANTLGWSFTMSKPQMLAIVLISAGLCGSSGGSSNDVSAVVSLVKAIIVPPVFYGLYILLVKYLVWVYV